MARKSKVKSQSDRTKPSKKKKASKKSAKKPALIVADTIGVISTITISRDMKNAIRLGVTDTNIKLQFTYVGSYKKAKLKKKFDKLDNDNTVSVIVTLGGNKTYHVAADANSNTKQFVSLVGSTPAQPPTTCKGGVTLNSYGQNKARVDYLVAPPKSKTRTRIGLLCNPNSSMNVDEERNWTNTVLAGPIFHAGKDATADENDSATYTQAFIDIGNVRPTMQALVISADPFFQDTMDELVAEANRSGLYITYPLPQYQNAFDPPTSGMATVQGYDLMSAYTKLGQLAMSVFQTGNDQGFQAVAVTAPAPRDI